VIPKKNAFGGSSFWYGHTVLFFWLKYRDLKGCPGKIGKTTGKYVFLDAEINGTQRILLPGGVVREPQKIFFYYVHRAVYYFNQISPETQRF